MRCRSGRLTRHTAFPAGLRCPPMVNLTVLTAGIPRPPFIRAPDIPNRELT